jgi:putative SOS response-associated peptidase YedK
MCGRMNVSDDPNVQAFMDALGMPIYPEPNPDLRPTDETLLIIPEKSGMTAKTMSWGIQPSWSKQLLINAKSETIAEKPTFKSAFNLHRGLVVCSGWYEWKDEGGKKKQKYLIQHSLKQPMLMAAVYYPVTNQFVTLTTSPSDKLKQVHHRTPLIIHGDEMDIWLNGTQEDTLPLMHSLRDAEVEFQAVS